MARKGIQVTYYLSKECVDFVEAQAAKFGISKSKAMQMSLDIWKTGDILMLETFGGRKPTGAEMAAWLIAADKALDELGAHDAQA